MLLIAAFPYKNALCRFRQRAFITRYHLHLSLCFLLSARFLSGRISEVYPLTGIKRECLLLLFSAFRFQSYLLQFLSETASQQTAILSGGGHCILLFFFTFDFFDCIHYHTLYEIAVRLSRDKIGFCLSSQRKTADKLLQPGRLFRKLPAGNCAFFRRCGV